jgi:hypothetical protein
MVKLPPSQPSHLQGKGVLARLGSLEFPPPERGRAQDWVGVSITLFRTRKPQMPIICLKAAMGRLNK